MLVGLWSWSADKLSLHPLVMKLDFDKQTVLIVHSPISGIIVHATMPGCLEQSIIQLFCSKLLIEINGALKMVSEVGSRVQSFKPMTFQS